MPVVSIRLSDNLYRQLRRRAYAADLSISAFLHPVIADAVSPGNGSYIFTANDALLAIALQTFAVVAAHAADQAPAAFARGTEQARAWLAERNLLREEGDEA